MNDEIATAMGQLAAMLGSYYLQLQEHGFPQYMAIELVRDFQRLQWERMTKQTDAERNASKQETANGR